MSTTIPATAAAGELRLPLDEIRVRENVRDLDPVHVESLAQSIALRGLLVPLIVRRVDDRYELVAGYHRLAACQALGLDDAPVVLREREGTSADSAAENVTRKALTPLEEARAVQAMLDEGYTLDGAAQALGWTRQLASARVKILKLPALAQQLVGSGEIPVSAVENLLTVAAASPVLAQAVAETIADGDLRGSELVNNPTWATSRGAARLPKDAFAAYLDKIDADEHKTLRLGKKSAELVAEAERLHREVNAHAYGSPSFRFAEQDVDQARAAGVLIEFPEGRGYGNPAAIITDQAVYRELAKQVIPRTVKELRARLAQKGKRKPTTSAAGKAAPTPRQELDTEHRASGREFARQAHAVNLDLGTALLTGLSSVAPDDIDVARFFAFGLLGPQTSAFHGSGDHTARTIAANGLRLVLDEHHTATTPTLKSGKPGKTKIVYGDVDDAAKWLWRFVDAAKTASELYGRALVVFAAQHYASQLVLPNNLRRPSVLPRSHKDTARKAFERVTKQMLPASYVQLQRALAAEARAYDKQIAELDTRARHKAVAATEPGEASDAAGETIDDDLESDPVVVGDQGGEQEAARD